MRSGSDASNPPERTCAVDHRLDVLLREVPPRTGEDLRRRGRPRPAAVLLPEAGLPGVLHQRRHRRIVAGPLPLALERLPVRADVDRHHVRRAEHLSPVEREVPGLHVRRPGAARSTGSAAGRRARIGPDPPARTAGSARTARPAPPARGQTDRWAWLRPRTARGSCGDSPRAATGVVTAFRWASARSVRDPHPAGRCAASRAGTVPTAGRDPEPADSIVRRSRGTRVRCQAPSLSGARPRMCEQRARWCSRPTGYGRRPSSTTPRARATSRLRRQSAPGGLPRRLLDVPRQAAAEPLRAEAAASAGRRRRGPPPRPTSAHRWRRSRVPTSGSRAASITTSPVT